jgi:glycine/serine hydroxymethyltransferase
MKNKIKEIITIRELTKSFINFHKTSIPLCAAENVMSDFTKAALSSSFQERYIMGSAFNFTMNDNFIGADYLLPFYKQISILGDELFHAKFTDVRTLTGMNAANMLFSALLKQGDNVMILDKRWGGHASMSPTLERLGANVFAAPYNLENYDFNYDLLNYEILKNKIKLLSIAPSDILFPHDLSKIDNNDCVILLDYSQILGLIAAGLLENPLDKLNNCILFGGTHKTIPGPAHGIIMTNNEKLFKIIDEEINPKYLRNVQMHQIVSLLLTLIEMKYFGYEYQKNTVRIGNILGYELENYGLKIIKNNGIYTKTHQLFLEMPQKEMNIMFENAILEHITLNTKNKPLFHGGFGIRLGLQEISRYNWNDTVIKDIAKVIFMISNLEYDRGIIKNIVKNLPPKKIHFTFNKSEYKYIF